VRCCNSECFIIVHNKDSDKIFSFTSDKKFNLEKISTLVVRDVAQGSLLHKNKKFVDEDFEKIKSNIMMIQTINNGYTDNQLNNNEESSHLQNRNELMCHAAENGPDPSESVTENQTEEMSM
jgi:hypothetical protein